MKHKIDLKINKRELGILIETFQEINELKDVEFIIIKLIQLKGNRYEINNE